MAAAVQKRTLVSVDDLLSVVIRCNAETCGAEMTYRLDQTLNLRDSCPNCQTTYLHDGTKPPIQVARTLIQQIQAIRAVPRNGPPPATLLIQIAPDLD